MGNTMGGTSFASFSQGASVRLSARRTEDVKSAEAVKNARNAQGARGARMRLTRRGRVVAVLLAAVLAWMLCSLVTPPRQADSAPAPTEVTSYVVAPGDTLWAYASDITPAGGDVNDTIDMLVQLNHLNSEALQVGQRLVVPVER